VSSDQARAIVQSVPAFVTVVGLFVDPAPVAVRAALDAVSLDLLQFHGNEAADFCASFGRPYIKAVPVKPGVDLLQYAARYRDARGLLFDAFEPGGLPGGTGKTFDWNELPGELQRPLILSGGLTPENVGAAIRTARPWAADVSSGVEVSGEDGRPRKGIKSAAKIAAFIREVRNADE
jgi:phosphoribosylanthranilate isomerase